jgi:hypothetical protein
LIANGAYMGTKAARLQAHLPVRAWLANANGFNLGVEDADTAFDITYLSYEA